MKGGHGRGRNEDQPGSGLAQDLYNAGFANQSQARRNKMLRNQTQTRQLRPPGLNVGGENTYRLRHVEDNPRWGSHGRNHLVCGGHDHRGEGDYIWVRQQGPYRVFLAERSIERGELQVG